MSYSKSFGPVSLSEAGGVVTISVDDSVSVGGGAIAGVVSAKGQASAEISGLLLLDAGLAAGEAKFPQFAAEIALLKGALDAEIAKL